MSNLSGGHAMSIRARKPPHGELDAFAGEFAPGFDLGHVGRFGKAAEHFARLLPRLLARQREGLASKRVAWPRTERFRRAASDIGGTTTDTHDSLIPQCRAERVARRVLANHHRAFGPRRPRLLALARGSPFSGVRLTSQSLRRSGLADQALAQHRERTARAPDCGYPLVPRRVAVHSTNLLACESLLFLGFEFLHRFLHRPSP